MKNSWECVNDVGNKIYHVRYMIALLMLMILTIGCFHGDSMSAYDYYIQTGQGNENLYPIMGQARIIRSDEWVVTTPSKLASSFGEHPFSRYNQIQRGTDTLNILNGVEINAYSVMRNPFIVGWLFLSRDMAFSLNWYAPIIMAFMIAMEFFYIIGGRRKSIAVTGACLTVFSSFYLWWGFPTVIWAMQGCVVCAYYFLTVDKRAYKALFLLGFVASFLNFATPLYPAWQVPFGFIALMLVIWLFHEQWDKVKKLTKWDWMMFGVAIVITLSLIAYYLWDTLIYIQTISQTVYPGNRADNGGYFLNKLFYYFQAVEYAYKDLSTYAVGATASEKSAFFSLFPLPTIAACMMVYKDKKKDWFLLPLLGLLVPMLLYVTVGLPGIVAKILFFSRSTRIRMVDAIGFIQILFICYLTGKKHVLCKLQKGILLGVTAVSAVVALVVCKIDFPEYIISKKYMLVMIAVICAIGFGLFVAEKRWIESVALVLCIAVSLRTGVMVRPVMRTLDAIYEKPVAKEIMALTEENPDAKWMTVDMEFVCSGFLVACGAPTMNSVNTYPNMELWTMLDPTGQYEEIYNRYAHVVVSLTDEATSMELVAADNMLLHLSYEDIEKTGVTYIMTGDELQNSVSCKFTKLYDEAGCKIYQVAYQ